MSPINAFGGLPDGVDPGIRDRVMDAETPTDARDLDRDVRAAMGEPIPASDAAPASRLEELHALRQTRSLTNEEGDEYAGLMQSHTFNEIVDLATPVGDVRALAGAAGDVAEWATGR
jgi:hypothetical protein